MSFDSGLVAFAIVVGQLLAHANVAGGDEYDVGTRGGLEQLGLTIAVEFRVI